MIKILAWIFIIISVLAYTIVMAFLKRRGITNKESKCFTIGYYTGGIVVILATIGALILVYL